MWNEIKNSCCTGLLNGWEDIDGYFLKKSAPKPCAKAGHMPWMVFLFLYLVLDRIHLIVPPEAAWPVLYYKRTMLLRNNWQAALGELLLEEFVVKISRGRFGNIPVNAGHISDRCQTIFLQFINSHSIVTWDKYKLLAVFLLIFILSLIFPLAFLRAFFFLDSI